jgi:hypothetical protein
LTSFGVVALGNKLSITSRVRYVDMDISAAAADGPEAKRRTGAAVTRQFQENVRSPQRPSVPPVLSV